MRVRMTIVAGLATLAGSAGLYPLFSGGGWFVHALGAVVAVMAGGMLVRRFRVPAVFSAFGGVAALHLYLTAVHVPGAAWLGVIPTPSSERALADLIGDGWQAANQYAAPVPLVPGISLLAAAGVGLVAVLVDLLAVRLRRAAPAGLPLLAMYSVPAAVREDDVSWLAFGLGALGFLALLMSDSREQVGGWGRAVFTPRWSEEVPMAGAGAPQDGPARGERPDSSALAASGRRIGAAAVAVAVLLPAAVPGIHPRGLFGMGGGGEGDGGLRTVTTPDPLVSLKRELARQDDSVVLTYRSDDPAGPDYLRLYALDRFDGDRWTYNALQSSEEDRLAGRTLPAAPGLGAAPSHVVKTRVQVRPEVKRMTFLPVPYAPARVSIKGDWRVHPASLMVYSLRDSAGGRSFTVESIRAQPSGAELAAASSAPSDILDQYASVPGNVPPQVKALAREVTSGATTGYGQAVRLQRWFTEKGGFRYDLAAQPPQHGGELADFLLHNRRGYCEQFAAGMAVMARVLGIPSRVAMGYTPGEQNRAGEWTVRSRDAHAWPELYFEGAGWVRFEPTPAGPAGQGTAVAPAYSEPSSDAPGREAGQENAPKPGSPSSEPEPGTPGSGPRHNQDLGPADGPAAEPVITDDDGGGGFPMAWLGAALLVALMLLSVPLVVRLLSRRRHWAAVAPRGKKPRRDAPPRRRGPSPGIGRDPDPADAAHAAWGEMRADALDHGLDWRASDSPRAVARRLGELLELDDPGSGALGRIAHAEELARYSRSQQAVPPESLKADVRTVREAFAASVGRGTRLRARLLPPSTVDLTFSVLRGAGGRTLEAANRLDDLAGRLGRRVRRKDRGHPE
ncbi:MULTISPECIES: DUF3488 and transglutaminase-like domain-containing protein [Thermomonosporaceae]|uniref:transglutaminase family protein n=1 Tax=Thermomonosporaceae TaxID=2012 RepID=UPI00255B0217|nr:MULTISPECIES: DUF3488 and transglutaminase-like domain-containing protein [Thermomonosporaceae]MDL4771020.1 DUF3488 and transglutaminase-like domain-containing protein [Actinomadura xylanilytica]